MINEKGGSKMRDSIDGRLKVFIFILSIICPAFSLSSDTAVSISFDRLFPQTPFAKVLSKCMQLYGEINDLSEKKFLVTSQENDAISDIVIGKLFQISKGIEGIACQSPKAHANDLEYLINIVDNILLEYKNIFSFESKRAKDEYVVDLINQIKLKLEKIVTLLN